MAVLSTYREEGARVTEGMPEGSVVKHLLETVDRGRAAVLTGSGGSGKSHTLQLVRTALTAAGDRPELVVGTASGSSVPLGAFAGLKDLPATALESPTAVVEAFARRRSRSVLLVDNVDLLDDASLYVVEQLIATTLMPTILTVRTLDSAPRGIRALYDGGQLTETVLSPLSDAEASVLISGLLDGGLTPRAQAEILAAGQGNPLHLRELVRGSLDEARLARTPHGWELDGSPAPSQRLTSLVAERFARLPEAAMEAATLIALAGECPIDAISDDARRALAGEDVIEITDCGWLRLSHPLDTQYLLSRCSSAVQHEIAHRAADALRGPAAASRSHARRQADMLALEHGFGFETPSMTALAEYALGSFDAGLALRAATAVVEVDRDAVTARYIAGLAASLLGDTETADGHFSEAQRIAGTDAERTSVALAHAQHLGVRHRDATAALHAVQEALAVVRDETSVAHLHGASLRWTVVAGQVHDALAAPHEAEAKTHEGAMSLITAGVAGVISGPLHETTMLLPAMREVPAESLALIPGGDALMELTETMALSYSGDVLATRRRLTQAIAFSRENQPESLGIWEYALGFLEFLSADADVAYSLGRAAVSHLGWRDSTGLLPAAHALVAAAATATGRSIEARTELERVPEPAANDPKVVMLRTWVEAWHAHSERRTDQSADMLLETAQWLMTAQHTYFAGMIAHCVARMGRRSAETAALLRTASDLAGGGLLRLFASHADAMVANDFAALEQLSLEASELGLITTATDTRLWLADVADRRKMSAIAARRHLVAADAVRAQAPTMALWNATPDRATLLTEREHHVVRLAAERYTAKEIAEINNVSVNTVTNQLTSAFRKLGIGSRAELRELLNF